MKRIPGYTKYMVDELGCIWGTRRKRYLKPFTHNRHPSVQLYDCDGKGKNFPIYQLVLATFIGPRPAGHRIVWIDGDRNNYSLENLKYDLTDRSK